LNSGKLTGQEIYPQRLGAVAVVVVVAAAAAVPDVGTYAEESVDADLGRPLTKK